MTAEYDPEEHKLGQARSGGELEVILSPKERESFRRALEDDFDSIMMSFSKVDLERSDTRNPKDKEMILAAVKRNIGMKELNARVKAMLREWLAKTAREELAAMPVDERATSMLITSVARLLLDLCTLTLYAPAALVCADLAARFEDRRAFL